MSLTQTCQSDGAAGGRGLLKAHLIAEGDAMPLPCLWFCCVLWAGSHVAASLISPSMALARVFSVVAESVALERMPTPMRLGGRSSEQPSPS